jgi:acetolactate synthase I/II/III large subunit
MLHNQGRYSAAKMISPEFAQLAQAYGVEGFKSKAEKKLRRSLRRAFNVPDLFSWSLI